MFGPYKDKKTLLRNCISYFWTSEDWQYHCPKERKEMAKTIDEVIEIYGSVEKVSCEMIADYFRKKSEFASEMSWKQSDEVFPMVAKDLYQGVTWEAIEEKYPIIRKPEFFNDKSYSYELSLGVTCGLSSLIMGIVRFIHSQNEIESLLKDAKEVNLTPVRFIIDMIDNGGEESLLPEIEEKINNSIYKVLKNA